MTLPKFVFLSNTKIHSVLQNLQLDSVLLQKIYKIQLEYLIDTKRMSTKSLETVVQIFIYYLLFITAVFELQFWYQYF